MVRPLVCCLLFVNACAYVCVQRAANAQLEKQHEADSDQKESIAEVSATHRLILVVIEC